MIPGNMICPKCGYEQTASAECTKCGVIISKYSATQEKIRKHAAKGIHRAKGRTRIQTALGVVGVVSAALLTSILLVLVVLFVSAFRPHELTSGEHLNSVDWLPPSATDISFTKRDGFGWINDYTCSIPQDDFLQLAAKNRWAMQREGSILFYEKRHPNGGGVTVFYDTDSQRLSVNSSHR